MVQSKKVITLIVLTLGIHCLRAESRWNAVRGEGFNVITDASGPDASKMAHRIEQMRVLLGGSTKVLPLQVVLLASEARFNQLRPSATVGGFYQSSADADWIVVRWGRADSERAMSHELVHAFLEHNGPRRPLWLEEGLAEFYSTAELDAKGWVIGQAVENHVRSLNGRAWLGEREFFEARPDSALREEGRRIGQFYAQSWAVVHYLLTTPGVREKAPALVTALGDGVPFARACESALGMRQGLLLEAARRAVEQRRFLTARIASGAGRQKAPQAVGMPNEEAEGILVSLSLAIGQTVEPATATTMAQKGLLALGAGKREEARKWLEEAVANGSTDPAAPFELAMLLREEKQQPERVAVLLQETIERNPNHAEAHFILGLQSESRGDVEGAIDYYQQAVRILPRQVTFWHALALALERTNRNGEAAHAAMRCRLAAKNASEREMAAAVQRLIQEPPADPALPRAAAQVPESWKGLRGDTTAEGELLKFDCAATPPLATVGTTDGRLRLRVAQPNAIRISGTGSVQHTFVCGEQKLPVRVEYKRATMELTGIEFR